MEDSATTEENPMPYNMPPFAQIMSDNEITSVTSCIRSSWGNNATEVSGKEIKKYRTTY